MGVVERGNTAIMVDYIRELADVDVFEIVPEVAYPDGYEDTKTVATAEINNNSRPAYKNEITNIADYQTIFIGGPIWWARPPMIFRTFFEAHPELDGKARSVWHTRRQQRGQLHDAHSGVLSQCYHSRIAGHQRQQHSRRIVEDHCGELVETSRH